MFFGFDDDQLAFRDAVRDLLDKQCPPEVVRAAWDAPAGQLDRTVWDHLADMGVLATLVVSTVRRKQSTKRSNTCRCMPTSSRSTHGRCTKWS